MMGRRLIILGFAAIAALFVIYGRYQDPELLTPGAIDTIQRIAYGFYITLAAALGGIGLGLYRYHRAKAAAGGSDLWSVLAQVTWNRRSRRIFAAVFVTYGAFFSMASGMLVYQPEVSFSHHYGAAIPSGFVAPCCDQPGYMPQIIVYLTDNVGLNVIPVNLVLQIAVSYLVGLNAAVAASAYSVSKRGKGASTVGAVAGLFIACPTCAGTLLSVFVGTASAIALSVALAQLQTLFIAVSIPVLLATPYLLARGLRNPDGSCRVV